MLDKTGQLPLYIQLKDMIQRKIEDGTYPEDTAIPSERELCNMYDVSRITVRQAINLATSEGLLVKRQGKGTYVASKKIVQALEQITLFDQTMTGLGLFPRTLVIEAKRVSATDKIYNALEVNKRTPLVRVSLLGMADSEPLAVYISYFRPELGALMAQRATEWGSENRPFTSFDLYRDISEGLRPVRARQTFEARLASGRVARYLRLSEPAALFVVESIVEARNGVLVEYRTVYYRADRYKFSITREITT
ncbi:MAG: GntR family transcriptional regulator [Bacillota bacterium]|jgi:GntR family transcriptional regulator